MTQLDLDLKQLCAQPAYLRTLLHFAKMAGIFSPTAGASETLQSREGRRSLGLEILLESSRGLPRGASVEQMLALLLREANPKETEDADQPNDIDRD